MSIAFACPECEHDLHVQDQLAGRRIKCPECGGTIAVPDDDAAIAAGPPRSSRRSGDDRPRKKKRKKSNTPLIVGLAAGGVLLIGIAVLLIVLLTRGGDEKKGRDQVKGKPTPTPAVDQKAAGQDAPPAGDKVPEFGKNKRPAGGIRVRADRVKRLLELRDIGHLYAAFLGD